MDADLAAAEDAKMHQVSTAPYNCDLIPPFLVSYDIQSKQAFYQQKAQSTGIEQ